jgi:hypothetical protein
MPISWNEIRNRAYKFVNEWKDETDEHAEAKTFWGFLPKTAKFPAAPFKPLSYKRLRTKIDFRFC